MAHHDDSKRQTEEGLPRLGKGGGGSLCVEEGVLGHARWRLVLACSARSCMPSRAGSSSTSPELARSGCTLTSTPAAPSPRAFDAHVWPRFGTPHSRHLRQHRGKTQPIELTTRRAAQQAHIAEAGPPAPWCPYALVRRPIRVTLLNGTALRRGHGRCVRDRGEHGALHRDRHGAITVVTCMVRVACERRRMGRIVQWCSWCEPGLGCSMTEGLIERRRAKLL